VVGCQIDANGAIRFTFIIDGPTPSELNPVAGRTQAPTRGSSHGGELLQRVTGDGHPAHEKHPPHARQIDNL